MELDTSYPAIQFYDIDASDEAYIMVRAVKGVVGLTISFKTDGDLATFMPIESCEELLITLGKAMMQAKAETDKI